MPDIAILLYDRLTALDAIGPYEVLRGLPSSTLRFVAAEPGPKRTDHGSLALVADHSLADVPSPDIIVVPGGPGEVAVRAGAESLEWLRNAHATSEWTTSVCTGSLILGAAGLLEGKRATSHWTALDELRAFGAEPTDERIVVEGKVVTAAGVSSGIDMALWLTAQVAGEDVAKAIQLAIEYDPQPPFDCGSTSKAPPHVVELLRSSSRFADSSERAAT
jgi:transcriptional regulator GlxA family with amidase domain